MRSTPFIGVLLMVVAVEGIAPLFHTQDAVKDSYFVILKDGFNANEIFDGLSVQAENLNLKFKKKLLFRKILNGFVVEMSSEFVDKVRELDAVKYVEQDGVVYEDETWGLDRIDQEDLPLDDVYNPVGDGKGVNVYILDTGIRITHEDFEGRASFAFDAMDYAIGNNGDCRGHGTHCAGTVAGARYGVAKKANVLAVRVLGCAGSGSWASVVNGMDWVAQNAVQPAVASMSLGGGGFRAVDEGVKGMFDAGVLVTVSAGNDYGISCRKSPARAPEALTVGASNINDIKASFSNFGGCVDIFGPGRYITAAYNRADDDYAILSGTSMSTPHVAGVAAVHLGLNPSLTPTELRDILLNTATRQTLDGLKDSPNLMLFIPSAP